MKKKGFMLATFLLVLCLGVGFTYVNMQEKSELEEKILSLETKISDLESENQIYKKTAAEFQKLNHSHINTIHKLELDNSQLREYTQVLKDILNNVDEEWLAVQRLAKELKNEREQDQNN